ncbi:MAG TPA: hypothetical protein DDW52_23635 [Planctomycetaceae bacterium]|nr:hypothetical protein [Planctomycetaceae bacterium]
MLESELVQWVHKIDTPEIAEQRWHEYTRRRQSGQVFSRESTPSNTSLFAAAYFLSLPGRVATLGGVRAEQPKFGSQLVNELASQCLASGIEQVQAITSTNAKSASEILLASDMKWVTQVAHIFRRADEDVQRTSPPPELVLCSASEFAACRVAQIIQATFSGTQDCPEINGLRSPNDVLLGFLEGVPLRCCDSWFIAMYRGEIAGCLLLTTASATLTELSYVGVLPGFRQLGIGKSLIGSALQISRRCGADHLAAAVDCRNAPALRAYDAFGFEHHLSLDVWLHREHLNRASVAIEPARSSEKRL